VSIERCALGFSKLIGSSPVLLFLGAGASTGIGKPTVAQFVEKLKKTIQLESGKELLHILAAARDNDLEKILGDLEVFLNLPYLTAVQCDSKYQDTAALAEGDTTITRDEAALLRSAIRHEIIREYRVIDHNAVQIVYEPLFDLIFRYVDPVGHCLPIFTTNYDLAIERFCEPLYSKYDLTEGLDVDPFSKTAYWDRNEFDLFSLRQGVRNLVQFKLHGSVDWMRITKSGRIVRALAMYDAMDSDEYQNAIIYPTGDKAANREPYFTAYEYFSRCCEQAELLIVIGYSFRDYETLNRLTGAHGRNENLRVVLLAPNAWALTQVFDGDLVDSFSNLRLSVTPIATYFGQTSKQADYLQEIEKALKRRSVREDDSK
jgi:SIR2-like domain